MIEPFGTIKTKEMIVYPGWLTVASLSECNCFLVTSEFISSDLRTCHSEYEGIWVSLNGFLKAPIELLEGKFLRIHNNYNSTAWANCFTELKPFIKFEYEDVPLSTMAIRTERSEDVL